MRAHLTHLSISAVSPIRSLSPTPIPRVPCGSAGVRPYVLNQHVPRIPVLANAPLLGLQHLIPLTWLINRQPPTLVASTHFDRATLTIPLASSAPAV
jgi:hypothetical protein